MLVIFKDNVNLNFNHTSEGESKEDFKSFSTRNQGMHIRNNWEIYVWYAPTNLKISSNVFEEHIQPVYLKSVSERDESANSLSSILFHEKINLFFLNNNMNLSDFFDI